MGEITIRNYQVFFTILLIHWAINLTILMIMHKARFIHAALYYVAFMGVLFTFELSRCWVNLFYLDSLFILPIEVFYIENLLVGSYYFCIGSFVFNQVRKLLRSI